MVWHGTSVYAMYPANFIVKENQCAPMTRLSSPQRIQTVSSQCYAGFWSHMCHTMLSISVMYQSCIRRKMDSKQATAVEDSSVLVQQGAIRLIRYVVCIYQVHCCSKTATCPGKCELVILEPLMACIFGYLKRISHRTLFHWKLHC